MGETHQDRSFSGWWVSPTLQDSVSLPPRLVAFAAGIGASFEVSNYPTEFNSADQTSQGSLRARSSTGNAAFGR